MRRTSCLAPSLALLVLSCGVSFASMASAADPPRLPAPTSGPAHAPPAGVAPARTPGTPALPVVPTGPGSARVPPTGRLPSAMTVTDVTPTRSSDRRELAVPGAMDAYTTAVVPRGSAPSASRTLQETTPRSLPATQGRLASRTAGGGEVVDVERIDAPANMWFTDAEWKSARAAGLSRPYTEDEKRRIGAGDFTVVQVGGNRDRSGGSAAFLHPTKDFFGSALPPANHRGLPAAVRVGLPPPTAPALVLPSVAAPARAGVPALPALTGGREAKALPGPSRPALPAPAAATGTDVATRLTR